MPPNDPSRPPDFGAKIDSQFLQFICKNWYLLASYLVPITIVMALITVHDGIGIDVQWFAAGAKYLLAAIGLLYLCYLAWTILAGQRDSDKI